MPNLSVIVPVYNMQLYLPQCLDSLVNQTLKDIEIICVNDGSTDSSQEIIDRFKKLNPEKIVALEISNAGPSEARNQALAHATGDYIAFCDADDFARIDMYEKLYTKAMEKNAEIAYCKAMDFFDDGREMPSGYQILPDINNILENKSYLFRISPVIWDKIIKRDIFEKYNIRFPVGLRSGDVDVILKILFLANKISGVDDFLYYYRQHNNSITHKYDKKILDNLKILEDVKNFYINHNAYHEFQGELEYLFIVHGILKCVSSIQYMSSYSSQKKALKTLFSFIGEHFPKWIDNPYLQMDILEKHRAFGLLRATRYRLYLKRLFRYHGMPLPITWKLKRLFGKTHLLLSTSKKKSAI